MTDLPAIESADDLVRRIARELPSSKLSQLVEERIAELENRLAEAERANDAEEWRKLHARHAEDANCIADLKAVAECDLEQRKAGALAALDMVDSLAQDSGVIERVRRRIEAGDWEPKP